MSITILKDGDEVLWKRTRRDTGVHRPTLLKEVAKIQFKNGFTSKEELREYLMGNYKDLGRPDAERHAEKRIRIEMKEGYIEEYFRDEVFMLGYRLTNKGARLVLAFLITECV